MLIVMTLAEKPQEVVVTQRADYSTMGKDSRRALMMVIDSQMDLRRALTMVTQMDLRRALLLVMDSLLGTPYPTDDVG